MNVIWIHSWLTVRFIWGTLKMLLFVYYCTVPGTYFTCIHFTFFFCTQTAKKPEDLRRYSSQVGLSEHDAISLSSAQRHRYSFFFFSLMFPALCWSIMHILSVLNRFWGPLWLWTPAQVNDNLNPSWVHFLSSCSSLVLVTKTAALCLCVCGSHTCTLGTNLSPEMTQTAQNLPMGTSSKVKVM